MPLSEQSRQQVETIFSLTKQMGELTGEKAWPQISELEQQRRHCLQSLLEAVRDEEREAIADVIRRLMEADRLIMEVGNEEKLRLMEEILHLGKGRRASKAYSETP
jgi:hypothetical protein